MPETAENAPVPTDRQALLNELRWKKFPVLDDGFVCLVDVMGEDNSDRPSRTSQLRRGDQERCPTTEL